MRRLTAALAAIAVPCVAAAQDGNKYNISAVEKAACTADAIRLCSHTYPDQDALLGCLRGNMPNLSLVCSITFKAGLKRRNIPLS